MYRSFAIYVVIVCLPIARIYSLHETNVVRTSTVGEVNIYLTTDFDYYYIYQDDMDFAYTFQTGVGNSPTAILSGGQLDYVDFGWRPGFKVGIGVESTDPNPWGGYVEYFRLHQKARGSVTEPSGGSVWARWVQVELSDTPLVRSVSSTWSCDIDWINLELGRRLSIANFSDIYPFLGIQGLWISQEMDVYVVGLNNDNDVSSNNSSRAGGVGPRLGAAGFFDLGKKFELYASAAGSVLATHYTVEKTEIDLPDNNLRWQSRTPLNAVRPLLEIHLGLAWSTEDTCCCGILRNFRIGVGYDTYVLWDQNIMRSIGDNGVGGQAAPIGDLFLQGLDLSFGFLF